MSKESKTIEKNFSDAEIMRMLLKELRYSGMAFGKELGYKSASTIHHILNGTNHISDEMVDKIIKVFPQVGFWFLKKGRLPVLLPEKLQQNQANLFRSETTKDTPDYSLETFTTLKNIEVLLEKLLVVFESKN
jgi:hypothetical protein